MNLAGDVYVVSYSVLPLFGGLSDDIFRSIVKVAGGVG